MRIVEKQLNLEEDELVSEKWKSIVKTAIAETMTAIEKPDVLAEEEREVELARVCLCTNRIKLICLAKTKRRKKAVIPVTPTSSPPKPEVKPPQVTSARPRSKKSAL